MPHMFLRALKPTLRVSPPRARRPPARSLVVRMGPAPPVPDTPMEVLSDLLEKARAAPDVASMKALVDEASRLASGLDPYLKAMSTPSSQVCQELIDASEGHDWTKAYEEKKTIFHQKRECCAGSLEGSLIATLCLLRGAKTVLEVGMFTGTTTLAIAGALPADGKVYALEIEPYLKDFAEPFFQKSGKAKQIEVLVGSATESIAALAKRGVRFDLVFLDADKTGYKGYYDQVMELDLLVPGGAIIVDNALMKGRVYAPPREPCESSDAIRVFNEAIIKDERVQVVALPFRDGVNIITRRKTDKGQDLDEQAAGNSVLQRFKLNSNVALVTGGGQGIGRAFAHALGEAGAAVAIVDVNKAGAEEVVHELRSKGVRSIAIQADVRKAADCQRMVAETVEQLGGLHIAINNAGVNRNSAAEDTPEAEWDLTFEVNTKGVFLGCQAEARHMLKQGYGRIINTASMSTLMVPHPQKQAAYNASKAAVVKLTQTLACEWADRGVTVNCMSPGIVNTALIHESPDLKPLLAEWLDQIPMGRLADVGDLQAAVVFMASGASRYMTGHNLAIEGGHTLW